MKNDKTSIGLNKKTKYALEQEKEYPKESYNDLLIKLLKLKRKL